MRENKLPRHQWGEPGTSVGYVGCKLWVEDRETLFHQGIQEYKPHSILSLFLSLFFFYFSLCSLTFLSLGIPQQQCNAQSHVKKKHRGFVSKKTQNNSFVLWRSQYYLCSALRQGVLKWLFMISEKCHTMIISQGFAPGTVLSQGLTKMTLQSCPNADN